MNVMEKMWHALFRERRARIKCKEFGDGAKRWSVQEKRGLLGKWYVVIGTICSSSEESLAEYRDVVARRERAERSSTLVKVSYRTLELGND